MTKPKTWTYNGETLTAAEWAAKLGKSRPNVQNTLKKKGIERAIADWKLWDSLGINHYNEKSVHRKKVLAMCICKCPRCEAVRKEPSIFERQLDKPPKINRVYCKSCREIVGRRGMTLT